MSLTLPPTASRTRSFTDKFLKSSGGYGWRHVFPHTAKTYPGALLLLFVTSVLAMALEIAGFSIVIFNISALEQAPITMPFGMEKLVPLISDAPAITIAVFVTAMAASALLHFLNGCLLAHYRRTSFEDVMTATINNLSKRPDDQFVFETGLRALPRILRRDCRYLSRSITAAMRLPAPLAILLSASVAGAIHYPYFTLIVVCILAVILPLHLLIGFWGGKVTDQLLKAGAAKSRADQKVIDSIFLSPYASAAADDGKEDVGRAHATSPIVQPFLRAYEKRIRTVPASMLLSRLSFLTVILFLGIFAARAYTLGNLSVAQILVFFIGLRFSMTALSELAAEVTNIISYSPLMSTLSNFLNGAQKPDSALFTCTLDGDVPTSESHLHLVSSMPLLKDVASAITSAISTSERPVQIVSGDYESLPDHMKIAHIKRKLGPLWEELSTQMRDSLRAVSSQKENVNPPAKSISALIDICDPEEPLDLYWPSASYNSIEPSDRNVLQTWLKNTRIIVVHTALPKRIPRNANGQVWTLQTHDLKYHCSANEFAAKRSEIRTYIEQTESQEAGPGDGFDDMV